MSSNTNTGIGTRILGTLRSADGAGIVRIEDRYDTDIADLWTALTDPDRLARWYGRVEGDLRAGGSFRVRIEAAEIDGTGSVEECEPPTRLRVTTRETDESAGAGGDAPFDEVVEATLTAEGAHTRLVIEVRGLPLAKIAAYGAGWQMHAESLAEDVAGREPADNGERWAVLIPAYTKMAADIT